MYFEQFTTPGLGCFSYMIGCPGAGVVAVVDPRRDIEIYLQRARERGMKITHIFDTHVHADHVSGAQELVWATGAPLFIHEDAPVTYTVKGLRHGDTFDLGAASIRVLHTPGHTPNSVSLVVTDTLRSPEPEMILTGDLLFVGDTGRPDLPGEEILDEQVRNLYDSLNNVLGELPDGLEVYPAHGQGSLCGGGMSARPSSTLGYERVANPRLRLKDFAAFKASILSRLPMRPQSFSHIIAVNLHGAPLLPACGQETAKALAPKEVDTLRGEKGVVLLDLRDSMAFAAAHIPGCLHVDAGRPPAMNWVGTVVPPASRLVLILGDEAEFFPRLTELRRIGYDNVAGFLDGGLDAWIASGREVRGLPLISAGELKRRLAGVNPPQVLDVRTPVEIAAGRIAGSVNLPFEELLAGAACSGPAEAERVVVCQSGYRAAIAAGLLLAGGCGSVSVLAGGFGAYKNA